MRKIIFILSSLLLVACSTKNPTPNNNNQEQSDDAVPTQEAVVKKPISKEEFYEHFDYSVTFESKSVSDYDYHPTIKYTTKVIVEISQLRSGFVTYSGTINFNVSVKWAYSTTNNEGGVVDATKSDSFSVSISTLDYETSNTYSKEYSTAHTFTSSYSDYEPESEIPYQGNNANHSPSAQSSIKDCNIEAIYYENGVSGDQSLRMKSYQVTIANYLYYFKVTDNVITPIDPSDLFDYRVVFTINGKTCTVRRNGKYTYTKESDESLKITNVEGYIDVYPGRVI